MNPQPSESPETDQDREALLKQFRAYLHLVITARQTGKDKELAAMDGPNMLTYCRALAELPDNTLAGELSRPVAAVLNQLADVSNYCEASLKRQDEKAVARHASSNRVLDQVDFALALILRHCHFLKRRAHRTKCSDFLCDTIYGMVINNSSDSVQLIRRYKELFPDQFRGPDDTYPDLDYLGDFAWDTYQRVEMLDKLADEFPVSIRQAAQGMHGWPMLMHRHTNNRRRFQQLAKRLELGEEYPLDASEGARFRPHTPLVRYLDPLIHRLHLFLWEIAYLDDSKPAKADKWMAREWAHWPEELPGGDVMQILRVVRQLPPLTKATAAQWTEKVLVPLILATDARDWKTCTEPALQAIANQKGVKSKATFKSRLLAAVAATLRRLARPA